MSAFDIGSVCIKKFGREAGRRCVVIDVIDKSFVLITGPKAFSEVRRRRVNINHLEYTGERLNIARGASDEDVMAALKAAGKAEAEPKT